ncbi:hypothetical protein BDF19DRAFT_382537 [Syncephalis fuscata]|nr:hypothetical protein BDF19DRAFT_382537 [Syncephalis fuscata]
MGELDPYMDEVFIKHAWMQLGENVQVKMIRDRYTGGNANYCFVDGGSYDNAGRLLAMYNGKIIPGTDKMFRLNWASGGNGNSNGNLTTSSMNGIRSNSTCSSDMDRSPEFSVFIGDLAPEVTEQMLLGLFQSYYVSVKSAKVVTDNVTGAPKGSYGFVRFFDEAEQHRAMVEMQGMFCGTRPMRISMATPKNRPGGPFTPLTNAVPPASVAVANSQMYGMSAHPYVAAAAAAAAANGLTPIMPAQHTATVEYNQFTDPNNTTVFVGGLTGYTTEDDLRTSFSAIGEVTYVKIPPGKNCGFVQFLHRAHAEKAIVQMNGCTIGTSRVRLSWGRPQHVPPTATASFQ